MGRCLIICALCSSVYALPLATPSADSSLGLDFPLAFCPLVVLLLLKIGYMGYRRHLMRPRENTGGSSLALHIGSFNIYLKLVQTAYLVGFLGSPAWETRTQEDTSHVSQRMLLAHSTSCSPSPISYSCILSGSAHAARDAPSCAPHDLHHVPLYPRTRCLQDGDIDYHSYSGVGSSIHTHPCPAPPPFFPAPVHLPAGSGAIPPQRSSPSLMQVMEPIFLAMTSVPKAPLVSVDVGIQPPARTGTPEDAHQAYSHPGSLGACSLSTCVPASHLPATAKRSARPSVSLPTFDIHAGPRDASSLDRFIVHAHQGVSVAPPPSVHHVASRPRSRILVPEERECGQFIYRVAPRSSQVFTDARDYIAQGEMGSKFCPEVKAPLSLTSRPLNGITKTDCGLSFITEAPLLSPMEALAGRRVAPKSKMSRKHRSGSPQIGPSPLRNTILLDPSTDVSVVDGSRPTSDVASICVSWDLNDLLVDGQLDINAVTAALGLGLSVGSAEATEHDNLVTTTGLCCSGPTDRHDTDSGVWTPGDDWERADAIMPTTSQVHVPGAQLSAIPEEVENMSSLELSPYAATSLCSLARASFVQFSDIDDGCMTEPASARTIASLSSDQRDPRIFCEEYWQDDRSWRDAGNVSRQ